MTKALDKLALFGGTPVLREPLPTYNSLGREELAAVCEVVRSGCLSGFFGSAGKGFLGGPQVRALEQAWCERFRVKHAVSVNSATSGLYAAMGAIGISPGDEVIVPPYTMSATAMAPLIYGGIPVFVDIEPDTFCLDVQSVRQAITPRTRAILAVNLFGHPAALAELKALAQKHRLKLVEDNAQGPLAMENGHHAGTVGEIGVFSLNYHKHIHTGEGGMCVTSDDRLAQRLQLIRNHGENVVEPLEIQDLTNLVGFNYRMTEMSAAMGLEQLKKVDHHVGRRERLARQLSEGIQALPGLTPPKVRPGCRHVSYCWCVRMEEQVVGVSRTLFSKALMAEGFPHFTGYVPPLYRLPIFRKRRAFGREGYPFSLSKIEYQPGICPVTERMHDRELFGYETCLYDVNDGNANLLIQAIRKVYEHRHELAKATSLSGSNGGERNA